MPQSRSGEYSPPDPVNVFFSEAVVVEYPAEEFRPFTKQEAEAFRAKQPLRMPWKMLLAQAAAGVILAVLLGIFGGVRWYSSALYGAAIVVIPGAMMVRGLKKPSGLLPGALLIRFAAWEVAKLLLAIAMMAVAPKLINDLSWPVLLLALVVCLKVNWAVLFFDHRRSVQRTIHTLKRDGTDVC
jgi:ATP synthase protein I